MPILNLSDQKYVIFFFGGGGGSKITVSCFKQRGGKPMKGMSNIFLRSYWIKKMQKMNDSSWNKHLGK